MNSVANTISELELFAVKNLLKISPLFYFCTHNYIPCLCLLLWVLFNFLVIGKWAFSFVRLFPLEGVEVGWGGVEVGWGRGEQQSLQTRMTTTFLGNAFQCHKARRALHIPHRKMASLGGRGWRGQGGIGVVLHAQNQGFCIYFILGCAKNKRCFPKTNRTREAW